MAKYSAIKENIKELPILLVNGGCPGGRNTCEVGKKRRKSFIFFISFRLALDNISKQAKSELDTSLLLDLHLPVIFLMP